MLLGVAIVLTVLFALSWVLSVFGSAMCNSTEIEWGPTWWLAGSAAVFYVLHHFFHHIPVTL